MQLAVAAAAAPPMTQLHTLAAFMHSNTAKGDYVYLHDDGGGGIAVSTASMLLIMKGQSWQAVQKDLTSGELASAKQRAKTSHSTADSSPGRPRSFPSGQSLQWCPDLPLVSCAYPPRVGSSWLDQPWESAAPLQ